MKDCKRRDTLIAAICTPKVKRNFRCCKKQYINVIYHSHIVIHGMTLIYLTKAEGILADTVNTDKYLRKSIKKHENFK